MSEEAELIAKAIESLQTDSNWLKEYLFPIVSSFLSALLGAWVAYFALRYQENIHIEKDKLTACNQWTLKVEGLFQSLIAFKSNYSGEINQDPFNRALKVRHIISHSKPLDENVSNLSFVIPLKEDPSSFKVKWRNLSRIGGMVANYNLILQIWEKRNEIERPLREKLISAHGEKGYVELSHDQIIRTLGHKDTYSLIDITERAIHLTDDIIVESNDFLEEFPDVAKSIIDTKKTRKYGRVLTFSTHENDRLKRMIKKCPEVDFDILVDIFGIPKKEIEQFYDNGY